MQDLLALFPSTPLITTIWKQSTKWNYIRRKKKGMCGLPQAGALENKLLKERLVPKGYFEVPYTSGYGNRYNVPLSSH